MKKYKPLAAFLLCLAVVSAFVPVTALAAGSIDLNHPRSLTVTADYDDMPISGMQFDAYLISTVDEYGELTVADRFQEHAADLDIRGKNDESWQAMAQILAREIMLDNNLKPGSSAVTDEAGAAVFSDIPMGVYLILGSTVERDGYVYSTSPFFAILPEQELSSDTWNYDVVANAKPGQEPLKADYRVIKVWKDDCHRDQRPKSISISLICDGEAFDTITLPHNGAWSYTWKDLETNHQWTVTEKNENGYKEPHVRQEGNIFVVTNTCNKPTSPAQPGNPTLPQTGLLWWPVPLLIAVGLLFVVIGLIRRRGARHEK